MNTLILGTSTFNYNDRGENTKIILPNGVTESRDTDLLGRTTKLDISNATSQLHEIKKTYTASGNISASSYGLATDNSKIDETYSHDKMNRTRDISSTFIGANSQNAYNDAGQLTKFNGSTVTLDNVGKPLSVGNVDIGYDSLGNRISETLTPSNLTKTTLNWDSSGLLDQVIQPASTITLDYGYTSDGLIDTRNKNNASENQEFIWDSNPENALMLNDGEYEYIYGVNRVPIAQIDTDTDEVTYLHTDTNGSVIASTNTNGTLAGVTNYNAYGKRLGSDLSSFGFAGEWTDGDTGYIFLRARWYDPNTGHFLSKDPIAQVTGEPYGYVGGNPLTRIDPSGLFFKQIGNFIKDTANNVVDFGKETVQAARDGDYMKVAANVGTALAVAGTVAAVGAFVIGTGGVGAGALVAAANIATVGSTALGVVTASESCSREGFSKNCQWGIINTATGAIPLMGGKIGKIINKESLGHKTIRKVTNENKWNNTRRNIKRTGIRIHEMPNKSLNLMKRRNPTMVAAYLGMNTVGSASLITSMRDIKLSQKEENSCK